MNGVVKPSYESRVTGGIWNYDLEIQCMDPVSCITTISSGYIKALFITRLRMFCERLQLNIKRTPWSDVTKNCYLG